MTCSLDAYRGADLAFAYVFPDSLDVTSYTAEMVVYAALGGAELLRLSATLTANGSYVAFDGQRLEVHLEQDDIDALPEAGTATEPSLLRFDVFITTVDLTYKLTGGLFRVMPFGAARCGCASDVCVSIDGDQYTIELAGARGANGVVVPVSAYMQTELTAASAAAARAVRGVQKRGWVDVTEYPFNAAGDGVTDDLAAFNAAHAYAYSVRKAVYMPGSAAGYLVSGTIQVQAPMFGDGQDTFLWTSSATADVIEILRSGVSLRDFTIASKLVRTAGRHVHYAGKTDIKIQNMKLLDWFDGIAATGTATVALKLQDVKLNNGIFHSCPGGRGVAIDTTTQSIDIDIDTVVVASTLASAPAVGLSFSYVGDLTLRRVSTVQCVRGLELNPGNGQDAQSVMVANSYFDTSSDVAVNIAPQAGGTVRQAKFSDVWACSSLDGFALRGAGTITDCTLMACTGSNNTGSGILLQNTNAKLQVIGGGFGQNNIGFSAAAGCSNFRLIGPTFGAIGQFGGNATYGIVLAAGCTNFTIGDCTLLANGTGPLSLGAPAGTAGQAWWIKDNLGLVTKASGSETLTSGGTSTVVVHGLAAAPTLNDIRITNTSGYGSAAKFWAVSPDATDFTIMTDANPGSGVSMSWSAAIWGAS